MTSGIDPDLVRQGHGQLLVAGRARDRRPGLAPRDAQQLVAVAATETDRHG